MSKVIKLKKGLDIKLNGEAEKVVQPAGKITSCALKPTDFRAMTPKLAVKVGDEVKAGDVLFIDKTHPEIKFTTPVSGTIEAINRGERRKLLEVVVKADAETRYRDFGKTEVSKLNRDEIIDRLLESGVWPLIKQRPYDIIADPMSTPKAVFVSAFDSAPLAPDYDLILNNQSKDLQTGIDCLCKLCNKNVNLGLQENTPSASVFTKLHPGVPISFSAFFTFTYGLSNNPILNFNRKIRLTARSMSASANRPSRASFHQIGTKTIST